MEEVLKKIKAYADQAHGDQKRKYADERYIAHPVRVMQLCENYTGDLPVLAAALLHDVLEDTRVTRGDLHRYLNTVMDEAAAGQTTHLVVELTDVYTKQLHPRWNRKKRKQKEALRIQNTSGDSQTVRYADIIDNCREIVQHDPEFARLFLCECKGLLKVIQKGNQNLYQQAVDVVNTSLQKARQA